MFDKIFLSTVADLFINLSAGWFGATIIVPIRVEKPRKIKLILLTFNLILGTVFTLLAYGIRKYG